MQHPQVPRFEESDRRVVPCGAYPGHLRLQETHNLLRAFFASFGGSGSASAPGMPHKGPRSAPVVPIKTGALSTVVPWEPMSLLLSHDC